MAGDARAHDPASPALGAANPSIRPRVASLLLGLSMFSTGASGLVSEYVLATLSTYILGNSIEQWSVTIGLMLFMMGVAAWVQRFVSDRGMLEKFLTVETSLAVLSASAPLAVYAAHGLFWTHFALVQYFFVVTIGFLIGFEIPLILRINERYQGTLRTNLATIFSLDYVGGLVGALVWTYVLLKVFPLTEISVLVAGANFLVACVTYLYFRRAGLTRRGWLAPLAIVATCAWLGVLLARSRDWSALLEQRLYDDPIVLSTTTRYQHIVLTYRREIGDYRLYLNGNTQFSSSDEAIYHEHLVHPVMHLARSREDVLILGGGDGLALREVLKYPDVRRVTLVDLDPGITRLARTHPALVALNDSAFHDARVTTLASAGVTGGAQRPVSAPLGRRTAAGMPETIEVASVQVVHIDAHRFIRAVRDRYDVVIVDFPDPNTVELAKLYSREFYSTLRRRVAPGGMVAIQATSPYHAREAFLCIQRTFAAAGFGTLPYHDNVPSFGEWGWVLGWPAGGRIARDVRQRAQALDDLDVATRYLTPEVFRSATVFPKGWLEPGPGHRGEINTLLSPVLFGMYLDGGWKLE